MEEYVPVNSFWDVPSVFGKKVDQIAKLDAGENPYADIKKMQRILNSCDIFNYYPDAVYKQLRKALAAYVGVTAQNLVVGAGCDEIIDLVLRTVLEEGDEVINCPPTFGMYTVLTSLNKGVVISVPRTSDYVINFEKIVETITDKTKAIIICSPNNPSGNTTPKADIIRLLKTKKLVIVDEAYVEFAKESVVDLLSQFENLIVLRTLSKWAGMAGLRLGYGIISPFLAKQIMKIKQPYNVNVAAEAVALNFLRNKKPLQKVIQTIIAEREKMREQLMEIADITTFLSEANFLFISCRKEDIKNLKVLFEKNAIALRYYDTGIRITIGRPEQNKKVIDVFRKYFNEKKILRVAQDDKGGKEKKIAFIDRDGTLIFEPQDTLQIDSIEKLQILDGVVESLQNLIKQGFELIMVTNQDGLGTSSFPTKNFEEPQKKLLDILKSNGVTFKKIYICPHVANEKCLCRKPNTGLVRDFLTNNMIDRKNHLFAEIEKAIDFLHKILAYGFFL